MHQETSPDIQPPVINNDKAELTDNDSFEPGPNLRQEGPDRNTVYTLAAFVVGLLAIGFIGFIFGATFNFRLVSGHGQYFGALQNIIYLELFVPIATLIFGVIALVRKNVLFLFYPVIAFFLAGILRTAAFTELATGYIPALPPANNPDYITCLIAVTLAYTLVQAYIWPLRQAITTRHMRSEYEKKTFMISSGLLILVIGVCGLAQTYSKPLLIAQQRSRALVHIPSSDSLIGRPDSEYTLYQQEGASFIDVGGVINKPVLKWWDRNTRDVCGNQIISSAHPGQVRTNSYKTSPGGVLYATAVFDDNASKPAVPTTAFKAYSYCFVLGYQQYTLVRNDRNGNAAYLQKYPSSQLIDAIAKAPTYIPACLKKRLMYCKTSDTGPLNQLDTKYYRHAPSAYVPDSLLPAVTTPTADKNAYKQVGKLSIPAWSISFPLSTETQDAYPVQKNGDEFIIKLHSLDSQSCFDGEGVAYLMRKPLSGIQKTANHTIHGQIVGNYVYSLYGNADLGFCVSRSNLTSAQATKLNDAFTWAEANIQ